MGELDRPNALAAAERYLSTAAPAIQGDGGDARTFFTAAALKDLGVSQDQCLDLLLSSGWNDRCEPPWEVSELGTKVRNAYMYGREPPGIRSPDVMFDSTDDDEDLPSIPVAVGPFENPGDFSDRGLAKLFLQIAGRDVKFNFVSKKWMVWNGRYWETDRSGRVRLLVAKLSARLRAIAGGWGDQREADEIWKAARRADSAQGIRNILEVAQPMAPVRSEDFDRDPWLLNCENGTLDLQTGLLRPHNRDDLITKLAAVTFDPESKAPVFEAFLGRIFSGDVKLIGYVQRLLGYSLTGITREQGVYVANGSGANGKSTLLNAFRSLLGDYAATARPESFMVKKNESIPNDLAALRGVRLTVAAETEDAQQFAESLIKQVTGGEELTVRFLYEEFFSYVPTFKLVICTNHRPSIRGTDHAIWRRISLIPFNVTIPEAQQDKELPAKLAAERSGILNWALEGCLAWQREGLRPPDVVVHATENYRGEQDTLGRFLAEECNTGPNLQVKAGTLQAAYQEWCRDNGEAALGPKLLSKALAERGFTRSARTARGYHWQGIGLPETGEGAERDSAVPMSGNELIDDDFLN